MLLCRTLGDGISTKEYEKSTCEGTINWVTSLIRIRETVQYLRSVCKKPDTKGYCAIKITKQTFDRPPMVFGQHVHKLGEFVHGKGDIWPNHPEMLEATNHLTVALINTVPSLAVREVPTVSGVETGLEPSMLCLLRSPMTYFY